MNENYMNIVFVFFSVGGKPCAVAVATQTSPNGEAEAIMKLTRRVESLEAKYGRLEFVEEKVGQIKPELVESKGGHVSGDARVSVEFCTPLLTDDS